MKWPPCQSTYILLLIWRTLLLHPHPVAVGALAVDLSHQVMRHQRRQLRADNDHSPENYYNLRKLQFTELLST